MLRHIEGQGMFRYIQALLRRMEPLEDIFGTLRNPCIYKPAIFRTLTYLKPETSHRERGEASSALFENRQKCPDFIKKGPDCVHLWVKFSIENVNLRVITSKISEMFSCELLFLVFLCFWWNVYRRALVSPTPLPSLSPDLKISGRAPAFRSLLYLRKYTTRPHI